MNESIHSFFLWSIGLSATSTMALTKSSPHHHRPHRTSFRSRVSDLLALDRKGVSIPLATELVRPREKIIYLYLPAPWPGFSSCYFVIIKVKIAMFTAKGPRLKKKQCFCRRSVNNVIPRSLESIYVFNVKAGPDVLC